MQPCVTYRSYEFCRMIPSVLEEKVIARKLQVVYLVYCSSLLQIGMSEYVVYIFCMLTERKKCCITARLGNRFRLLSDFNPSLTYATAGATELCSVYWLAD